MKSITIILLFTSLMNVKCNSQNKINYIPYYREVIKADSLYVLKKYNESFKVLDSLFKLYEPINQDILREIETYFNVAVETNNIDKAQNIIYPLISKWGFDYESLPNYVKEKIRINKEVIEKLNKQYKERIDWTTRQEVIEMNLLDQIYHRNPDKKDSLDIIDKRHYDKIMLWLEKGLLTPSKIGYPRRGQNTDISVVLVHIIDQDKKGLLKKVLYNELIEGRMSPLNYALTIDRDNINNGENQKYYSFNRVENEQNLDSINTIRKEIGLYSLGYIDWRNGLLYN